MSLLDKLRGELIDIIEWTEPSENDILAYRFPRYHNEIKMGARLIVREGQNAVFVKDGEIADVFTPGTYTLHTENMPLLSTLAGWKYGFHSPFKAEVYFIAMRQWTDLKWGTPQPIMLAHSEFGPVRLRAFGTYAMHVSDPATFLRELVATDPSFETYEITNQLRNAIVSRVADVLGRLDIPVLELAGNYERISHLARAKLAPDLAAIGLALTAFYVENISLPAEVEQALDKRTEMGVVGDLGQYARYQAATAIGDAARNPGGMAGVGAGLGAGMAIGSQMAGTLPAVPPPLPGAVCFYISKDGQPTGPFDLTTLARLAGAGQFTRSTLVWKQGMAEWTAAEGIPELQPLLLKVPPPSGK
jgi:membrane protease subunit (stomatin/prohibitin family)